MTSVRAIWLHRARPTRPSPSGSWRATRARIRRSGHPTVDQPHGCSDEQNGEREQPATLDPLE